MVRPDFFLKVEIDDQATVKLTGEVDRDLMSSNLMGREVDVELVERVN